MIVNYQMIVASLLHPDIDVFVSDDSWGEGKISFAWSGIKWFLGGSSL